MAKGPGYRRICDQVAWSPPAGKLECPSGEQLASGAHVSSDRAVVLAGVA
ncbi:MAG TPA: hypothetical protein VGH53_08060 [Streptosporangiaceae bacterium]